ncbi:hypothetical protein B6A27_18300 [Anoxybacillus sp. UARK-01]|uniref:acyl-CoA dehydrogenase family protein n=1 Tax=Anoxybacillus sp. UARK-01 TaxID=1895648 RepID=UPI0009BA4877|nr:acyl-CoA dehydrogenase family protein [Anoxybacillus sp. UARK-01]OQM44146.1 hypothetical protein B6A27_18300 [Anoxybacillus sp. UARK-01]
MMKMLYNQSPMLEGLEQVINNIVQRESVNLINGLEFISNVKGYYQDETNQSEIWNNLKDIGVPGYNIPLKDGGYELGTEVVLMICESMGKHLFRSPYLDTMIAADILTKSETPELFENEIEQIVSGDLFMSVIGINNTSKNTLLKKADFEWTISGRNNFAINLSELSKLIIVVDNNVFFIPIERNGIIATPQNSITNETIYSLEFKNLTLHKEDMVKIEQHELKKILASARLRQASYLLGLSRGALSEAIKYVNIRRQFGKKLIDNQSIGFKLASLLGQLEAAKLKIHYTASLDIERDDLIQLATEALAYISELSLQISRESLHLHGAFGMTKLAKIEKYYRFIAFESVRLGTPKSLWIEAGKLNLHSFHNSTK